MRSVREIKQLTEKFFERKGIPNPKTDTDRLIAHCLGIKRLDIYLDLERPLERLGELRSLVRRRAKREPLQYLIGRTEFYGLAIKVDRRALIPRPETEELVDQIIGRPDLAPKRILDLGTGSGVLALALAAQFPEAEVTAVDQSAPALELASENANALGFQERITFLEGDWWEPIRPGERFDLIVSNPPYLTEAEMETAQPEVVDYEPQAALVAGVDGLDHFRVLLRSISDFLSPRGVVAMEMGMAQSRSLTELADRAGLSGNSVKDLSGRPRFFFLRR